MRWTSDLSRLWLSASKHWENSGLRAGAMFAKTTTRASASIRYLPLLKALSRPFAIWYFEATCAHQLKSPQYLNLKRALAERHCDDWEAYVTGKNPFIRSRESSALLWWHAQAR